MHITQTILPELAHEEPPLTMRLVQSRNEFPQELLGEMFHSVETNAFEGHFFGQPDTPVNHILADFWVVVVEIGEHEIIIIPFLAVHIIRVSPILGVIPQDLVDGRLVVVGVVVRAGEVIPVVLLLAVLFLPRLEIKAQPAIDLVRLADLLGAVFGIDLLRAALLLVVRGGLVVQHGVPVDAHADVVCGLDHLQQLLLGAPFGGDGPLSVELAEVVEVVDVVAVAGRRGGFASGRHPDVVDAGGFEGGHGRRETRPVLVVVWDVPFETLHHGHVFGRRGLLCGR